MSKEHIVFYYNVMFSCYLQRELTKWYSMETASCLGKNERALYQQISIHTAPCMSFTEYLCSKVYCKETLPQLSTAG